MKKQDNEVTSLFAVEEKKYTTDVEVIFAPHFLLEKYILALIE